MPKLIKLIVFIVAVTVVAIYAYSIFQIKTVTINAQDCLKAGDLNLKGNLIFTINQQKLGRQLTQKFPCLSKINIKKNFPSNININAGVQKPSAQIAGSDFQITSGGLVVEGKNSELPQLFLPGDVKVQQDEKISDEKITFAAKVAGLVQKTDFHAASIRFVNHDNVAIYDIDQTVVLLTTAKSPDEQIDSLQQVLSAAKIENAKVAKIDLRFDKPVISFK